MPPNERRALFVSPDQYELGGLEGGHVGLRIATAEVDALLPALDLILRLSPAEARSMADGLTRWADLVGGRGDA